MTVRLSNVPALSEPPGYHHLAVADGRTLVFTAGQVPLDGSGELVGEGDAVRQTEQVLANLLLSPEAAGARAEQVVKTTVYVVGGDHDRQAAVWNVVRDSPVGASPSTLVGVASLGYRGQLVEIEAVAVRD
ncbi:MAG: RidA family protein [Actinomycetota bacterium]|nr:RidA family protein [Actinomycetota bacterium]